jgi:hypothetical protein
MKLASDQHAHQRSAPIHEAGSASASTGTVACLRRRGSKSRRILAVREQAFRMLGSGSPLPDDLALGAIDSGLTGAGLLLALSLGAGHIGQFR